MSIGKAIEEFEKNNAPAMDIYAKQGTKVKVIMKDGEPFGGYEHDKERVMDHLKPDEIYEIDYIEIEIWNSKVYLIGIREGFNTVLFTEDLNWKEGEK